MDPSIVPFYRQYLQQMLDLCYPPAKVLLQPYIQDEIFRYMFGPNNGPNLPPDSYQKRVLKTILEKIESAIQDPDEDEISDGLMAHMSTLFTLPQVSPAEIAQQRTIVSYFPPIKASESNLNTIQPIRIAESRNLLALGGNVGFRTWDASLRLGHWLCTTTAGRKLIERRSVLELGAGTGLVSILCAQYLGAASVLPTDGNPDVVKGIDRNVRLNAPGSDDGDGGVSAAEAEQDHGHGVMASARVLDWADVAALPSLLSLSSSRSTAASSPSSRPPSPPITTVLGADITYNDELFPALTRLFSALTNHLAPPPTTTQEQYHHHQQQQQQHSPQLDIVICSAIRNTATWVAFEAACAQQGFDVVPVPFEPPPLHSQMGFFHATALEIRIVRVVKRR